MKHKFISQKDQKDCAVTCLYNIIRYYDGYIDIDKLYNKLNTDKNGTSVYNIVKTSNELGLSSTAYKCELNDLCSITFPTIAHIKVDKKYNHFIIINKIVDDEIFIFDPIRGYIKYELDVFEEEWTNIIITFHKTSNLVHESKYNSLLIKKYLRNNKKIIITVFILSVFSSLLSLFYPFYIGNIFDKNKTPSNIFCLFISVFIIGIFIDYIKNKLIIRYSSKFDQKLTNNIYSKILDLPILYHHNRPVGDIISRINDLSSLKNLINTISFSIVIDIIAFLMICIIILIKNKILFLILSILLFIYVFIYLIHRKNVDNYSLLLKESNSSSSSYLVESLFGIDTVKNLNLEKKFTQIFKNKYNNFINNNINYTKSIINFELFHSYYMYFTCILLISIGMIYYKRNAISISFLISLNSIIIYMFNSIKNFISFDELLIESKNSYRRLKSLYFEKEYSDKGKNINFTQKIQFKNLSYSYNNTKTLLNNVNFVINKGDYVFIDGKSGDGKSTLFKLLTKEMQIKKGMIKIDDIDINKISKRSLLNNICLVSQNEYIFTDSILNNIKLFKKAKKEDIDKVLEITDINEVLKEKNITLDYLLEENGHNISGGERQRILIARSLLQNKSIIVFDETMNELDVESERKILKKIKTEYNSTLILISHRLNNSDLFNKVITI